MDLVEWRVPTSKPHTRLSSYHLDDEGRRVEHTIGTLVHGPPRRLVFRWVQDGRRVDVALDEAPDGTFGGLLEYPGSPGWGPDRVVASLGNVDPHHWEVELTCKSVHGFDPWEMTIYAAALKARDKT